MVYLFRPTMRRKAKTTNATIPAMKNIPSADIEEKGRGK